MKRDFLGLSSKNAPIAVKEETSHSSKDSGSARAVEMQRSFSGKVSCTPQALYFKPSFQEDKQKKSSNDNFVSSGFMYPSATDAFDSNQKPYCIAVESMQSFDAYTDHRPQGVRIYPNSDQLKQTITTSSSVPALQSRLGTGGKKFIGHGINTQPVGGVPIMATPVSVLPAPSSIVGTTDTRTGSKMLGVPAQLTIFYAGSVCVHEDVSPEKAQAIMLLAGNGSSTDQNKTLSMPRVSSSIPCSPVSGGYVGNNSRATTPCSTLQSSVPTISYISSQSGQSSNRNNRIPAVKATGGLSSSHTQTEPLRFSDSARSAGTAMIPAVALPQARKASLVRFLEKRKDRVTSTSPYTINKKFSDCGTAVERVSSSVPCAASTHSR